MNQVKHIKQTMAQSALAVEKHRFNERQTGGHNMAIKHLGNEHISLPVLLAIDPILEPVDKIVYTVIRILSPSSLAVGNQGELAYPTYDDICRFANIKSHATVARSLAILRLTRWLVSDQVRCEAGIMANIYLTHDSPMTVASMNELDPHYAEYIVECLSHFHNRVRNVAEIILQQQENDLIDGQYDNDHGLHSLEQTMESVSFVNGQKDAAFFGIQRGLIDQLNNTRYTKQENNTDKSPNELSTELLTDLSTSKVIHSENEQEENTHTSLIFEEPINQRLNPSLNIKEYNKQTKIPSLNIKEGIPEGSLIFKEGDLTGSSNIKEPSSSSSSSNYINTTTTLESDFENKPPDEFEKLIAERFSMLSDAYRFRIHRMFSRIPENERADLVYEASNRIRYGTTPIRNPISYVGGLISAYLKGEYNFSEYAFPDYSPDKKTSDEQRKPTVNEQIQQLNLEMNSQWQDIKRWESECQNNPNEIARKTLDNSKQKFSKLSQERDALIQQQKHHEQHKGIVK